MTATNETEAVSANLLQQVEAVTNPDESEAIRLDTEREARRRVQKRRYYHETFQQKKRRVHGTLDRSEYDELAKRAEAEGRSPWQQLLAESRAYQSGMYVPSAQVENELQRLNVECRRIGNNLNQMAKRINILGRLRYEGSIKSELRALLEAIENTTKRLWRHREDLAPSSEGNEKTRASE